MICLQILRYLTFFTKNHSRSFILLPYCNGLSPNHIWRFKNDNSIHEKINKGSAVIFAVMRNMSSSIYVILMKKLLELINLHQSQCIIYLRYIRCFQLFIYLTKQAQLHLFVNFRHIKFFRLSQIFKEIIIIKLAQSEMGNRNRGIQTTSYLKSSLKSCINTYQLLGKDKIYFSGLFSQVQITSIRQLLKDDRKFSVQFKPCDCYPYLNSLRRTIWKFLLIVPTLQYQPIQPFEHIANSAKQSGNSQIKICIKSDIKRTFTQSKQLDKIQLQKLSLALFCHVFQPIGYTSGETYVLAFLLLCGFNETEVFHIFISLKLNKNFQFARYISDQNQRETFVEKISQKFQEYLKKFNQKLYKVFCNFPVPINYMCYSQMYTLFCNFGYQKMNSIAILWNDMICCSETLAQSFLRIYSQFAYLWYIDEYPKVAQSADSAQQLQNWSIYIRKASEQDCLKAIKKIKNEKITAFQQQIRREFLFSCQPVNQYEGYVSKICGKFKILKN